MENYLIVLSRDRKISESLRPVFRARIIQGEIKLGDKVKLYNLEGNDWKINSVVSAIVKNEKLSEQAQAGDSILLELSQVKALTDDEYIIITDENLLHAYFRLELENNENVHRFLQQKRVYTVLSDIEDIFDKEIYSVVSETIETRGDKLLADVEMIKPYYLTEGANVSLRLKREENKQVKGKVVKIFR